ncbi:MAG: hypothetical protein ACOC2C_01335 [Cyclonatronaceae bacterium]
MLQYLSQNLFDFNKKETPGEVIFFKIFELFIVAQVIYHAFYWGLYVSRISEVVLPLGLANYIDVSFMFGTDLAVWNGVLITGLSLLGFMRIAPKIVYPVAMLLFHWQYVVRFSLGEIPHSANLIGFSLLAFAVAHVCYSNPLMMRRFTLGFIYFFGGLGYTSAAISKFVGTGMSWADGRHLWMWMSEKSVDILSRTGEFEFNLLQTLAFDYVWIATLILIIGLLTEFFGFMMWFKKLRVYIFTATIAMHVGITLTMNIRFDAFVMQLILMGYPWAKGIDMLIDRQKAFDQLHRFSLKFA